MPRLIRQATRTAVIAGTATAVSNNVSRRQSRRWAAEGASAMPAAPPPPAQVPAPAPAPAAPAATDRFAALAQLGELKAQGILTDAEFEAEKSKILAS